VQLGFPSIHRASRDFLNLFSEKPWVSHRKPEEEEEEEEEDAALSGGASRQVQRPVG
jgi:hypothetical protein